MGPFTTHVYSAVIGRKENKVHVVALALVAGKAHADDASIRAALAQAISDWVIDTVVLPLPGNGTFAGNLRCLLIHQAMEHVDWGEIADAILGGFKDSA